MEQEISNYDSHRHVSTLSLSEIESVCSRTILAVHFANFKPIYIIVNVGIFLILVIGKTPQLHRVRIFGINSTPGIDMKVEYKPKGQ